MIPKAVYGETLFTFGTASVLRQRAERMHTGKEYKKLGPGGRIRGKVNFLCSNLVENYTRRLDYEVTL